jgi:hypothetical protein
MACSLSEHAPQMKILFIFLSLFVFFLSLCQGSTLDRENQGPDNCESLQSKLLILIEEVTSFKSSILKKAEIQKERFLKSYLRKFANFRTVDNVEWKGNECKPLNIKVRSIRKDYLEAYDEFQLNAELLIKNTKAGIDDNISTLRTYMERMNDSLNAMENIANPVPDYTVMVKGSVETHQTRELLRITKMHCPWRKKRCAKIYQTLRVVLARKG